MLLHLLALLRVAAQAAPAAGRCSTGCLASVLASGTQAGKGPSQREVAARQRRPEWQHSADARTAQGMPAARRVSTHEAQPPQRIARRWWAAAAAAAAHLYSCSSAACPSR